MNDNQAERIIELLGYIVDDLNHLSETFEVVMNKVIREMKFK
jgi:hypothetical protein